MSKFLAIQEIIYEIKYLEGTSYCVFPKSIVKMHAISDNAQHYVAVVSQVR